MKRSEKGFTNIELIVALAIMVLIAGAASITTFQVCKGTGRNNDRMTVLSQVQSAGYWISCDAQTAHSVNVDNLTSPDFLILNWTERDYADEPTYHTATYFFQDVTDGIGRLKRSHWSSAGANEQTLVAEYIYYDPDDPDDTSKADYQAPALTVQLTAVYDEAIETREYRISHRPNL